MKQQSYKTPGQLIRDDIRRLGWNQSRLCEALGTDRSIVSKLINDKLAMMPDRACALSLITGRPAWDYFQAQAWLWFTQGGPVQGMARVNGRRKKEGEK